MDAGTLYGLGIALIFVGILVVLASFILLLFSSIKREGRVRGGGAIIIGPLPIIFGTDKESVKTVLLLSITLIILLIILTVMLHLML
jgi:uncharacterized protein (TIGR00304 family)